MKMYSGERNGALYMSNMTNSCPFYRKARKVGHDIGPKVIPKRKIVHVFNYYFHEEVLPGSISYYCYTFWLGPFSGLNARSPLFFSVVGNFDKLKK